MVTIRSIHRLFLLGIILLIIAYLLKDKILYIYPGIPIVDILAMSTIILIVAMMFYYIILVLIVICVANGITPPAESLAEKMMRCRLRIEKGLDYCAKCPDGYTCASGKTSPK